MIAAPTQINGAKVLCFTSIDERLRPTGNCKQIVGEVLQGPAACLAICQYENDDGIYLFGCDREWNCVTDTLHESLDRAKVQAEFEYEGISATWQTHV